MAQSFYSISLQAASFPMLSEQQSRTIIGATVGKAPAQQDRPGASYCHNVMPTREGYDSVGYLSLIPAFIPLVPGRIFTDVRVVYGDARSRLYLAWDTNGSVYALVEGSTNWVAVNPTVPATGGAGFTTESVTIGTVNGVSYIYYSKIGAFNYNEITGKLDSVTLTGLDVSTVLGVVGSSGYLIAYTDEAIAWSSTLVPTDFVPDKVTGSGGGNVAGIAGSILFATYDTLGILVYTSANTIAGTYTGNVQFPFKFREIEDSKGGISLDKVAYEANGSKQFVYSKAGLQTITSRKAEVILPEITDFLAGRRFEDYNETTKLYEVTDLTPAQTMQKKIKYVASRYLIISYGISSFTHALVFDTALNRLGKLKLTHTDVFEYVDTQTEISKETVAFVLSTGEVQILDFSTPAVSSGVLILGKLQATRTRLFTLLGVEVENIESPANLTVDSQVSLDGKNFTVSAGTLRNSGTNIAEYAFRATAKNHSLVFTGKFNLSVAQVRYTVASKR